MSLAGAGRGVRALFGRAADDRRRAPATSRSSLLGRAVLGAPGPASAEQWRCTSWTPAPISAIVATKGARSHLALSKPRQVMPFFDLSPPRSHRRRGRVRQRGFRCASPGRRGRPARRMSGAPARPPSGSRGAERVRARSGAVHPRRTAQRRIEELEVKLPRRTSAARAGIQLRRSGPHDPRPPLIKT